MNEKQEKGLAYFILIEIAMIIGVARTINILYDVAWWKSTLASFGMALAITVWWIRYFKKKNEKKRK